MGGIGYALGLILAGVGWSLAVERPAREPLLAAGAILILLEFLVQMRHTIRRDRRGD